MVEVNKSSRSDSQSVSLDSRWIIRLPNIDLDVLPSEDEESVFDVLDMCDDEAWPTTDVLNGTTSQGCRTTLTNGPLVGHLEQWPFSSRNSLLAAHLPQTCKNWFVYFYFLINNNSKILGLVNWELLMDFQLVAPVSAVFDLCCGLQEFATCTSQVINYKE